MVSEDGGKPAEHQAQGACAGVPQEYSKVHMYAYVYSIRTVYDVYIYICKC